MVCDQRALPQKFAALDEPVPANKVTENNFHRSAALFNTMGMKKPIYKIFDRNAKLAVFKQQSEDAASEFIKQLKQDNGPIVKVGAGTVAASRRRRSGPRGAPGRACAAVGVIMDDVPELPAIRDGLVAEDPEEAAVAAGA